LQDETGHPGGTGVHLHPCAGCVHLRADGLRVPVVDLRGAAGR
jgi:hypothetical protein